MSEQPVWLRAAIGYREAHTTQGLVMKASEILRRGRFGHRRDHGPAARRRRPQQARGLDPMIPEAKPQGQLPSLKMPTARGWSPGKTPVAAPGLKVNAFAAGSQASALRLRAAQRRRARRRVHDRAGQATNLFDHAIKATMARAGAIGREPQPHHPAARCGRRRRRRGARDLPLGAQPALRHRARRRRRSTSATPTACSAFPYEHGPDEDHRAGQAAHGPTRPVVTGRAT